MRRSARVIIFVAVLAATVAAQTRGLTRANFEKLQTGMSYEQVVQIVGRSGEVYTESEFMGTRTVGYIWKATKADKAAPGASMSIVFQDDKLLSKSQYGLR